MLRSRGFWLNSELLNKRERVLFHLQCIKNIKRELGESESIAKLAKVLPYLSCILFIAYVCWEIYIYLSYNALSQDEIWFFGEMHRFHNIKWPHRIDNHLGYGSLYWYLYSRIDNIIFLRTVSLIFFLFICVFIFHFAFFHTKSKTQGWYAVIFWITFPISIFSGKLIGSEIFSQFLCMTGILIFIIPPPLSQLQPPPIKKIIIPYQWINTALKLCGGILLGAGIGVKITSVIFLIFISSYQVFKRFDKAVLIKNTLFCIKLWLACAVGFIITQPYMLFNFHEYFTVLKKQKTEYSLNLQNVKYTIHKMFFSDSYTWDLINTSGFLHSAISGFSLILIIVCFLFFKRKKDKQLALSLLTTMLFAIVMFVVGGYQYSWYLFPLIITMTFLILLLGPLNNVSKIAYSLLIVGNLCFQIPDFMDIIALKHKQIVNMEKPNRINELEDFKERYIYHNSACEKDSLYLIDGRPSGGSYNKIINYRNLSLNCLVFIDDRFEIIKEIKDFLNFSKLGYNNFEYIGMYDSVHIVRVYKKMDDVS
jgi:hypothetical protein